MIHRILLSGITLFVCVVMLSSQTQATTPIPRLEKRGEVIQWIVDGKPFIVLADETDCDTSAKWTLSSEPWS